MQLSARRMQPFSPAARRVLKHFGKHALNNDKCRITINELQTELQTPLHLLRLTLNDLVRQGLIVKEETKSVVSYKMNVGRVKHLKTLPLAKYDAQMKKNQAFVSPLLTIGAKVVVTTTSSVDVLTVTAGTVSTITRAYENQCYIVVANEAVTQASYPSTGRDDPVVKIPVTFLFDKMTGKVFSFTLSPEGCVVTDVPKSEKATVAEWDPTKKYENTYPNTYGY